MAKFDEHAKKGQLGATRCFIEAKLVAANQQLEILTWVNELLRLFMVLPVVLLAVGLNSHDHCSNNRHGSMGL